MVAVFLLVANGKVLDTREAFTNLGTSSKGVDANDVVTRDAFTIIDSFFTDDDVTVAFHWECLR